MESPCMNLARPAHEASRRKPSVIARVAASVVGLPLAAVMIFIGAAAPRAAAEDNVKEVDFTRDIKPLLSNRCFFCHGPDEEERQGGIDGLRLDKFEGATEDLGGHAAIVAGDVASSVLIERVLSDDADLVMPPPESGQRLTADEVELLKKWIEQGANYAAHWSYVPPSRPALPEVKAKDWPRNEIDHFVLARLEREGLSPSVEADRHSLIRRLSLDLTGLPPTLDEVQRFVHDESPTAYESLVDRLMDKKTYGEHWARLWLDLARYADSAGYADDPGRTIWLYRDYVIESINANKPFDQFTIEQMAGDQLPGATDEQIIATAFHRNTLTNNEGGTNDEEFRNAAIVDRVNTTLAVWMGTTMACAQCHTHKYDPITQEEYFKIFAILNNTEDADRRDESPLHSVFTEEQKSLRDAWQKELDEIQQRLKTLTPELAAEQATWESEFPRDLSWRASKPREVTTQSGNQVTIDDTVVSVAGGADVDSYAVSLDLSGAVRAVRLETLADASLPASGPGHAGGNFVITGIRATITPPPSDSKPAINGRYVRVELPGNGKMVSLAEVQVFRGDENVALDGKASQSSTDFGGPANLAIDGNTDGRYAEAKSTTHTAISTDPWWEVDLGASTPVERIVIWNRTDGGTEARLSDFKVSVIDESRGTVWQEAIAESPRPSRELSLGGPRSIVFAQAIADYSQREFDAANVVKPFDASAKPQQRGGWAVGGKQGQSHSITLIASSAIDVAPGSVLTVTIDQQSQHVKHTVGRFRVSVTDDERVKRWAATPAPVIESLNRDVDQRTVDQRQIIEQHFLSIAPSLANARDRNTELTQLIGDLKPTTVPVMRELAEDKRRKTQIQLRGNFMNLGDEVGPGTPAVFPPLPGDRPADRLALAQWLIDDNNPLTARVIANRYWEKLFGIGIVSTSEDFGSQGAYPTHPELLDWLATELVRLRWDTKAFVKQLVMSAAYRQSSHVDAESYERDPDNQLLARGPRFRLTAETIRDQALAVSGLLSPKMFGAPVNPPQPSIGLSAAFGGGIDWQTSKGEDKFRRALYTTWRRSNPYPSMTTFDAPNREVCTLRRSRSNTPLQALVTLNDPVYMEAAQALARRMMLEAGNQVEDRARHGFMLCLARPPKPQELEVLIALFHESRQEFSEQPTEAMKLATDPIGPLPEPLESVDAAAWTTVANVLLNLDETLMPR